MPEDKTITLPGTLVARLEPIAESLGTTLEDFAQAALYAEADRVINRKQAPSRPLASQPEQKVEDIRQRPSQAKGDERWDAFVDPHYHDHMHE